MKVRVATAGAPPQLPGFVGVHRFWDSADGHWVAQVLPGEFYVTRSAEVIATTLGSCVSTCIRDPVIGIGGLNHFMLPEDPRNDAGGGAMRYGFFAVERLINVLIKHGARRENLEIKIFGGGKVIPGMSDVGRANIEFVRGYFETELLDIVAEDVGGNYARRVRYYPETGRAMVKRLPTGEANEVVRGERALKERLSMQPAAGEVELFGD
ncbi:MAG TPA: chemoreceptor glutamine deamidase CheD [Polyangiaceae bacterium]|nr:chemoreceptor glutamine deamidase CheD [Polyangiaceae bacterium]